MDYTGMRARYIKAENEKELENKLALLAEETNKMPQVSAIYPKGDKVIAWVMIDMRDYSKLPTPVEEPAKKKRTRKKKAS